MASASSYIVCPFPDFNWSIKSLATFGLARQVLIWVQHMKITGRGKVVFIFWVYVKAGNSWKTKIYSFVRIRMKNICQKKLRKFASSMVCISIYAMSLRLCNPLYMKNMGLEKFEWLSRSKKLFIQNIASEMTHFREAPKIMISKYLCNTRVLRGTF